MEDLKTNRDAQITVGSIVFFLLAFPLYFGFAAGNADDSLSGSVVADYRVNGELTYVELDSGTEYVADGTPWSDTFNTDAVNNADEMNIVGLRVTLSYGEDETANGLGCLAPGASDSDPDTVTGIASHLNFTANADGENNGGSGGHDVTVEWYNSSMVGGEVIEGLSMDDIKEQIDSMGAGLGDHTVEISVGAQAGGGPGCTHQDDGEEVSYVVELIVFDYTIVPVIEVQGS